MRDMPDLSIVVPVLDEEESLPLLAERIVAGCGAAGRSFEVWLVDDGSRDASWSVIEALHARDDRFAGVRFRRNFGKSAALAAAFERARGAYVITMDADLQDDPAEIPNLVAKLDEGFDLVSGWKKKRRDPWSKKVPSRFFNMVTRTISGIPLHDFNCGLKAYRSEVVRNIRIYGELHRYIPILAKWEGFERITEVPVVHHARQYGRTKFGLERLLRGFLDLLTVLFLTRFVARPMHFFGTLGSLAFLGGLAISAWLSFEKIVLGNPIGNRPLLLLGVLMILVGIQMFSTGLISEMVVVPRIQEARDRIVDEELPPGRAAVERHAAS